MLPWVWLARNLRRSSAPARLLYGEKRKRTGLHRQAPAGLLRGGERGAQLRRDGATCVATRVRGRRRQGRSRAPRVWQGRTQNSSPAPAARRRSGRLVDFQIRNAWRSWYVPGTSRCVVSLPVAWTPGFLWDFAERRPAPISLPLCGHQIFSQRFWKSDCYL